MTFPFELRFEKVLTREQQAAMSVREMCDYFGMNFEQRQTINVFDCTLNQLVAMEIME